MVEIVWVCITDYAGREEALWQLLAERERGLVAQQKRPQDRLCRLVSYGVLKLLLAERTGKALNELSIAREDGKKPYLEDSVAEFFSVSHSGEWICYALGGELPVGIDIEAMRPIEELASIVESCFSEEEKKAFASASDQHSYFYTVWCSKEAYLKGIGRGIATDLTAINTEACSIDSWHLHKQWAPPIYRAVLAVPHADPVCHYRLYPTNN
ncbi:Uncharacterized protein SCG7086_AB_00130 [Chlamydiales bacterium SCGC AG-110-P3]|nr:Uncharacterized protein SCG7086_AB_00130 [Chlamydiales bacterium SCGC AG-110-P3]